VIEMTDQTLRGAYLDTAPDVTPEIAHAAALTVAENALDQDDARVLLAALGLSGSLARIVTRLECGHPSTSGYRRVGARGVVCRRCMALRRTRAAS
jgi:hypothetical protein